jgi:hypothetical protein
MPSENLLNLLKKKKYFKKFSPEVVGYFSKRLFVRVNKLFNHFKRYSESTDNP